MFSLQVFGFPPESSCFLSHPSDTLFDWLSCTAHSIGGWEENWGGADGQVRETKLHGNGDMDYSENWCRFIGPNGYLYCKEMETMKSMPLHHN